MTNVNTYTGTYTVADIKNVFEDVGSQILMIGRTSKLWSTEYRAQIVEDTTAFACNKYLAAVHIVLYDENGSELRAHTWTPNTSASSWKSDEPIGNIWPATPKGSLTVVLTYNGTWHGLSERQRQNFRQSLNIPWGPSSIDTTFPELSVVGTSRYASRAYGVERVSRRRL